MVKNNSSLIRNQFNYGNTSIHNMDNFFIYLNAIECYWMRRRCCMVHNFKKSNNRYFRKKAKFIKKKKYWLITNVTCVISEFVSHLYFQRSPYKHFIEFMHSLRILLTQPYWCTATRLVISIDTIADFNKCFFVSLL